MKNSLFGASLAGSAILLAACGAYVGGGGGAVEVVPDYYGPAYGGAMVYGRPAYGADSRIAAPPRQNWRGSGPAQPSRGAPAARSATGKSDRDR